MPVIRVYLLYEINRNCTISHNIKAAVQPFFGQGLLHQIGVGCTVFNQKDYRPCFSCWFLHREL